MNEVSRIHLARVSYDIDIDAKKELEKYLDAVKKSLGKDVDAMEDIEIRMTEILAERGIVKDSVITEADIQTIIEQLGEPKNFASGEEEKVDDKSEKPVKKYYRDPDHAVLGGVIAGLAAYTGLDVTLLRVLAVVLTVIPSWGASIIVYIIVWIVAPEAKSVSEKMEMHGEPINLDSIKKSAKKFSDQAEVVGKDMSAKASKFGKKLEKEAPVIGQRVGRGIAMFFGIVGVVICAVALSGLVISCIWIIPILIQISGVISYAPLFAASVGLALGGAFMLCVLGISLCSMLIDLKPKKRTVGLVTSTVVALVLLTSAVCTGLTWTTLVGQDDIRAVRELFNKNVILHINNNNGKNVDVEIRPFRVNIETRN